MLWTFDRLDRIGGHPTTVLGNPRVIDTPVGKAIEFDGVDDALLVDVHPLAGAETFTWEAVFRPDGGAVEQRWFHLQESGSDNRMLFEIRVNGGQWFLDSYGHSGAAQKALIDRTKLHPLRRVVSRGQRLRRTHVPQLREPRGAGRGGDAVRAAGAGTILDRRADQPGQLLQGRDSPRAFHAPRVAGLGLPAGTTQVTYPARSSRVLTDARGASVTGSFGTSSE